MWQSIFHIYTNLHASSSWCSRNSSHQEQWISWGFPTIFKHLRCFQQEHSGTILALEACGGLLKWRVPKWMVLNGKSDQNKWFIDFYSPISANLHMWDDISYFGMYSDIKLHKIWHSVWPLFLWHLKRKFSPAPWNVLGMLLWWILTSPLNSESKKRSSSGWWFLATPLKKIRVRQLGW